MSRRKSIATFTLFACIVLGGIVALLLIQINESSRAAEERKANRESIEVLGAMTCERFDRLIATRLTTVDQPKVTRNPVLRVELDRRGFVSVSGVCQRFVSELLIEDLEFEDGKVQFKKNVQTDKDSG